MSDASKCPFVVGDVIHELTPTPFYCEWGFGTRLEPDRTRPDAIVTAITERGFTYEYDYPVPIGRAEWGEMATGGEVFEEGFGMWRKVGKVLGTRT